MSPAPGFPGTPTPTPAPTATDLEAQIVALEAEIAGLAPTVANPGFTPPTAGSVASGTEHLVAPLTPGQKALVAEITQMGLNPPAAVGSGLKMLGQTIQGKYLTPKSNPFLAAAISAAQRPLVETFKSVTVPDLLSRFTLGGQEVQGSGSSAFAHAAGETSRQFHEQLGDIGTNISAENYQKERDRQIEAASAASNISTQQMSNAISSLQAAALPQLIKDLGIQRGIAEFNKMIDTMLAALQIAAGVSVPAIGTSGTGSSSENPNILPLITAIAGMPI